MTKNLSGFGYVVKCIPRSNEIENQMRLYNLISKVIFGYIYNFPLLIGPTSGIRDPEHPK